MRRLVIALALLASGFAQAQELRIGAQANPSLDPHFLYIGTNVAVWRHLFGSLTVPDDKDQPQPSLAESFRLVDDRTWEFKLRPGVRFTDGSPLTADDVVFSLKRVPEVPRNPSQYTPRLETIADIVAADPQTVLIKTTVPNPFIPIQMTDIAIVSKKVVDGKTTADFTSGAAVVGSGPYRLVSFTDGDRLVLERNPTYWGAKPYWERVTFRVLGNDAARTAALLSGEVDLIEFVPPSDAAKLASNPAFSVFSTPSWRVIMFLLDFHDAPLAGLKDLSGAPLAKNPLQDVRVRQALSKAIDRDAIASRIMDGYAVPANQMVSDVMAGFDPTLPAAKADPAGAKSLLAAAGWPDGFAMTVGCPNNRYPNDAAICQAVGQMLSRGGIRATVDAAPMAVFMNKLRARTDQAGALPIGMLGLGQDAYPASLGLMVHTPDPKIGRGQYNFGGFADAELDRAIDEALTTLDPAARNDKLRKLVRRMADDVLVMPIHFQKTITATRRGFEHKPSFREETLAWDVTPKTP